MYINVIKDMGEGTITIVTTVKGETNPFPLTIAYTSYQQ